MNNLYDNFETEKKSDLHEFDDSEIVEKEDKEYNDDNKHIKKDMNSNKNIFISVGIIALIFLIIGGVVYYQLTNKKEKSDVNENEVEEKQQEEVQKVKIVNMDDKRRPYGVMINNHHAAWPQSGLSQSYLVYEIMVEGGITRMFALYTQNVDIEKIGSVRSARHNYIDYAQENDAILVHFGSSNIAEAQYPQFNQDHIDGNYSDSSYFYRDKSLGRALEHTAFTTSNNIKTAIQNRGFRNERKKDFLLNYVTKEVDLSTIEGNQVANNVSVTYSYYQTSSYEYDPTNKYYNRSMGGVKHTDLVTGEQYHFKNIIIYAVQYDTVDKSGHQDMKNVGSGSGYYITNGYAVPITWEKKSRTDETIYKYKDGREIEVNDGNTFIQIYPTNGSLAIS